jgi:hypothetical protein
MIPGPHKILRTTQTGSLVKIEALNSGNSSGARFWTDGKCIAPRMPDNPWLRRHPDSGELFWTDECEEIGTEVPWGETSEFPGVPFANEPSLEDLRQALADGLVSSEEKERYVRMRLWWATNDPVRLGQPDTLKDAGNLQKLLPLLDESNANQRLSAAEVCRELGDFDRAARLLDFAFPRAYERAAALIRKLNGAKDVDVHEVV